MFKKLLSMVLILALMLTATTTAFASSVTPVESKVGFVLDGKVQTWDEATLGKIFLSQGRSFVPLRVISEKLGYTVKWEQKTSTAIIEKGEAKISFKIGANEVSTPSGVVTLDVASFVMNGRTYVPMRGLFEALNAEIEWLSAKVTASNLGVSMTSLSKDFYVTVVTGENGTTTPTTVTKSDYMLQNGEINMDYWSDLLEPLVPSDVETDVDEYGFYVGEYVAIGSESVSLSRMPEGQMWLTIRQWQFDHVKAIVKATLVTLAGEADATEIYNRFANKVDTAGWIKAKNGTEYKFSNDMGYGVSIHVKSK